MMDRSKKKRKLSGDNVNVPASGAGKSSSPPSADAIAVSKDQRRSLFVRSLAPSVTTEMLAEHFSQNFPLKHATVVVDPTTKTSRGFGFVTFVDADDAQAARAQFHDSVLDGRKIKVDVAESRHRDVEDGSKSGPNMTAIQLRAQRERLRADTQPPRLIVRNLPWSVKTSDDLARLFQSYGKVKHAVVPKKGPRVQYGFGIVVLRGQKNAERAIQGVNGKVVDGRTLAVDWAVDKETWQEQQQQEHTNQQPASSPSPQDRAAGRSGRDNGHGIAPENLGVVDNESDANSATEDDQKSDAHTATEEEDDDASSLDDEVDLKPSQTREDANDSTVFVRNLPFATDDDALRNHFAAFGPVRYARVVYDPETERSRGTAFVCFFEVDDARACVQGSPKRDGPAGDATDGKRRVDAAKHSILEDEAADPSGRYTLDGRILHVSRALSRQDAERRAGEAAEQREAASRDKRRLYLLGEGSIPPSSPLYNQLGKAEIDLRASSARQRQRLVKGNPNLGLSLTRLSVRNLPREIGSKELKALAREAVVGFAKDVKAGLRQPLSKEELSRGAAEMRDAEHKRKLAGTGIVKQAKIVFEDRVGGKVKEGAGRSRGYGFIEYVSHRNALAALRWLNGHVVKAPNAGAERGKRLIVEFAIENAQVVQRRTEREKRTNRTERGDNADTADSRGDKKANTRPANSPASTNTPKDRKRKRGDGGAPADAAEVGGAETGHDEKNRVAKRNRIIAKKRQARNARKG